MDTNVSQANERQGADRWAHLEQKLKQLVAEADPPFVPARDSVTLENVHSMTDFCGDTNPIYRDPVFAAKSVHRGLVAPLAGLVTYSCATFEPVASASWIDEKGERRFRLDPNPKRQGGSAVKDPFEKMHQTFIEGGLASIAAVGCEMTILRYPRVGERLQFAPMRLVSFTGPKKTRLGEGYFAVALARCRGEDQTPVSESRYSIFFFEKAA